ncbi:MULTISPECIES: 2-amino-4-oxopentanoate thiolase subunit OrtB [unclassified Halanaerobium]|uniref:2-amino-4-oxopentanoate thiolase subunit OrtB n=1 Tax=unclassified Halanaerobium TaxID=2641197 RepID=UPI000DF417D6|nr:MULTISPECIES: 2-amino-4-oxopentanoate thiolase subunit OrtB [unclassified Halanaerobium]RCW41705.1 2-amino-4-ketopentanoate thiolase beta subunit [Halanaerobium sp. MA284_MarDTE_T2]RCW79284.1 2-amino-4-ketopentanoate thiolase beta subunit [Halanaerobium sp. DL-01]
MGKDMSYEAVMSRNNEIMKKAVGIDYTQFEYDGIGFNYEKMMNKTGYDLNEIIKIQEEGDVGNTPVYELKNLTKIARKLAPEGKGARIFLKDEASNPSGSFKARRASVSVYHAKKNGYKGVVAATSGNYGAAVASQAVKRGLKPIIIQEVYDSTGAGQPEIIEKGRKCEAYGSEVLQLSVGPELFYTFLKVLEETDYFNASLYTPFGIAGVETLGYELAEEIREKTGKFPEKVIVTNAGGGNLTGTARGINKAGAEDTEIVAASVDLSGLHMASDKDFNRKSFTTGHTGFGIPFLTWPDRSDVPRSAARAIRYLDRYVTVTQGEVFYITEALAQIEGIERGPAGNTSLAAAFSIAQEMDEDEILVVQETEYTGAGKHPTAQLTFAKKNGIEVKRGNPRKEIPGKSIIIPDSPGKIKAQDLDVVKLKKSHIKKIIEFNKVDKLSEKDMEYIIEETNTDYEFVKDTLNEMNVEV